MRFGLSLPPFAEFVDARAVADLAAAAEAAGWDGFFIWDHVVRSDDTMPVADPWVVLTAVALATSRVTIGPLVTPLPRRRVQVVARQSVTLDRLSGGRLVLGVGIGNDNGRELSAFGEEADAAARGRLLDESLDVLVALWSGEPVAHHGARLTVDRVRFLPRPAQSRIPLWVAGTWPRRRPLERALRYDGYAPVPVGALRPDDVRRVVESAPAGFDVVLQGERGRYDDGRPADLAALAGAGATWWVEAVQPTDRLADVRSRIDAGPPRAS